MPGLASLAFTVVFAIVAGSACGPRRLALPTGPGTPAPDYAEPLAAALARCQDVHTLQAELALSGHVGRQRLRGRVLTGLVPGALRLEGVAPVGGPVFILVADGDRGTLLLLRDRRVLLDAPPADILDALVGIALGPDDLRALLTGCLKASIEATGARQYGSDWIAADLPSSGAVYLHRQDGTWRFAAGRYSGLEIEYTRFTGDRPAQILIRSPERQSRSGEQPHADVALTVQLSQIDVNGDLPREQLVAVKIPPGVSPISLRELRESGPLGR
jgi:hypothetical protein